MRSLRKNPTRLRGTNFCTSSARFAPSFVRQLNGPECTQIVRTHQNISIGSNGVDRVCSLRNVRCDFVARTFAQCSARFAPSFVRQPSGPECTQIVQNAPKRQFWVQWGGSGAFVVKNPTQLRGTNFCTSSARFAPSFVRQPSGPECTQIV